MHLRAHWQFYKEIVPFIAAFTAICIALFGILWGYVLCVTVGFAVGIMSFYFFKKEQFYFYYNLGLTPWKLARFSFVLNGLVTLLVFFLLQLIFIFIRGSI